MLYPHPDSIALILSPSLSKDILIANPSPSVQVELWKEIQ